MVVNVHSASVEMFTVHQSKCSQCISASHADMSTLHQLQFHPVSEPKPRASGVTVNFEFCQGSMPSLLALARKLDSTSKLQIRRCATIFKPQPKKYLYGQNQGI